MRRFNFPQDLSNALVKPESTGGGGAGQPACLRMATRSDSSSRGPSPPSSGKTSAPGPMGRPGSMKPVPIDLTGRDTAADAPARGQGAVCCAVRSLGCSPAPAMSPIYA